MASLVLNGNTSGSVTISSPAVSGTTILTLPTTTDTLVGKTTTDTLTNKTLTSPAIDGTPTGVGVLTSSTSQATTSGTSIDFTSIPSWVKRITVMFNAVSISGGSIIEYRLGTSSGVEATGYTTMVGLVSTTSNTTRGATSTTGFINVHGGNLADSWYGSIVFTLLGNNNWIGSGSGYSNGQGNITIMSGGKTLAGTLDRIRITTQNGTDTFDAGSINILYE